jgi:hypothetical protein
MATDTPAEVPLRVATKVTLHEVSRLGREEHVERARNHRQTERFAHAGQRPARGHPVEPQSAEEGDRQDEEHRHHEPERVRAGERDGDETNVEAAIEHRQQRGARQQADDTPTRPPSGAPPFCDHGRRSALISGWIGVAARGQRQDGAPYLAEDVAA